MEIERKIYEGTFVYGDYFPKSQALRKLPPEERGKAAATNDPIYFGPFARRWLESQDGLLTPSSFRNYRTHILGKLIPAFGNMQLADIKPSNVREFAASLDLAPKTIKNIVGVLSAVLNAAVDDELISGNPCSRVRLPKVVKQKPDPFDFDEVLTILEYMKKRKPNLAAFFAIGFFAGLRTGEIMALKWSDIDWKRYELRVARTMTSGQLKESTKTGGSRAVDITPTLEPWLLEHAKLCPDQTGFMFTSQYGEPYRYHYNISRDYWYPALEELDLWPRKMYQMRHTFATMMLRAGEELAWIRDMLGHTTLKMLVETYGNWIDRKEGRRGVRFGKMFTSVSEEGAE